MAAPRKSWREKLADRKGLPKTGRATGKMSRRWGTGSFHQDKRLLVDGYESAIYSRLH